MDQDGFDPLLDAQANYGVVLAAKRLLDLLLGNRWATEHDTFDLVLAAGLMRYR